MEKYTFMYDHSLHRGRKHFCRYCLQAFTAEDCFKINDKQRIIMPKRGEFVKFKNYERTIKSPFIIYSDLESILVPGNNEKEYPEDSYTNILLAVMDINYYVSMISLVSLSRHTSEKMKFAGEDFISS